MGADSGHAMAGNSVARRNDGCGGVPVVGTGTKGRGGYGKDSEFGVSDPVFVGVGFGGGIEGKIKAAGIGGAYIDCRRDYVAKSV